MTVAPENVIFLYEAVKSLIENGYSEINLNCIYEKGWTEEHATIMYYQLKTLAEYILKNDLEDKLYISMFEEDFFRAKKPTELDNWCGGNGSMLAVDWKGDIYPCIRYMESSLGTEVKPLIIGNVDSGMMINQEQIDCVCGLKKVDRRTQSTDECFDCPIAEGCSWCFKAGTLITTHNGLIPIEDIKIGDSVLSGTGNSQIVSNINKRYTKDTLSIKASGTPIIYTTKEHPFIVKKLTQYNTHGLHGIYSEPQWVKAEDIKKI